MVSIIRAQESALVECACGQFATESENARKKMHASLRSNEASLLVVRTRVRSFSQLS